jgi:hypothetical protein
MKSEISVRGRKIFYNCEGGLMPRFWRNILYMLCACCFCASAKADDLDPDSSAYLSNKKYTKNIEIKAYFVTKEQVAKLFSEENVEITQKSNKELHGQEVFLLVRCKNVGDYKAFGILNCKIPNCGNPISIEVMMMSGHMKSFHDSVIYIGSGSIPNNNEVPVINCDWKSLYTI